MANTFDLGFVPKGWTKGEPLEFLRGVSHTMVVPKDRREKDGECYALSFLNEQCERVNVWLRWWYTNGEPKC